MLVVTTIAQAAPIRAATLCPTCARSFNFPTSSRSRRSGAKSARPTRSRV